MPRREKQASPNDESHGSAGREKSAEPRFLVVGRVSAPHGIRGELRVQVQTDFPERFHEGAEIWMGDPAEPFTVEKSRFLNDEAWVKLAGLNDRNAVEQFRGLDVLIPMEQAVALPEDAYYAHQIVGLEVWTDTGEHLGTVSNVLALPANDVYVVDSPQGEIWLPAIADVVLAIDLGGGRMTVHLQPGLL